MYSSLRPSRVLNIEAELVEPGPSAVFGTDTIAWQTRQQNFGTRLGTSLVFLNLSALALAPLDANF